MVRLLVVGFERVFVGGGWTQGQIVQTVRISPIIAHLEGESSDTCARYHIVDKSHEMHAYIAR